ncbi:MAG: 3-dehydroquinate synthase [Phycisphaerales bacterium]|nr:3-dehydroquinate synthase [Phycisphaerales bacterium]
MHLLKSLYNKKVVQFNNTPSFPQNVLEKNQRYIILIDKNLNKLYPNLCSNYQKIIIPVGEKAKTTTSLLYIIRQLIKLQVDRNTVLVGIGGGSVLDITGFVAAIFQRGIEFGFIPTTFLAMIDAAIGGKNGINIDQHKNIIGTFKLPAFVYYHLPFLKTLPDHIWAEGCAEMIKHACIGDPLLLNTLQKNTLASFKNKSNNYLQRIIEQNINLKSKIIKNDLFDKHERKILNFGHTVGHAIELLYNIAHGYAIAIGMVIELQINEIVHGYQFQDALKKILQNFQLPISFNIDKREVWHLMHADKKKVNDRIQLVGFKKLGHGFLYTLSIVQLKEIFFTI